MVKVVIGLAFLVGFLFGAMTEYKSYGGNLAAWGYGILGYAVFLLLPGVIFVLWGILSIRRKRRVIAQTLAMFQERQYVDSCEISRELNVAELYVLKILSRLMRHEKIPMTADIRKSDVISEANDPLPYREVKCLGCGREYQATWKHSALGFPVFTCSECNKRSVYPLTSGYRLFYQTMAAILICGFITTVGKGALPIPGLLGVVAILGIIALFKDRGIRKSLESEKRKD